MSPFEVFEVFLFGFTLLVTDLVSGYGNGAPTKICDTLLPGHGSPQRSLALFTIQVSQPYFVPNGSITVSIVGDIYRGLMMQARYPGRISPVGTFSDFPDGTKPLECSAPDDTVTHASMSPKGHRAVYTWTAPPNIQGDIHFVATVAVHMRTWWVNLQSAVITLKLPTTTPAAKTTTSVATTVTTTSTTPATTPTTATTTELHMTSSEKSHGIPVTQFIDLIMDDKDLKPNQVITPNKTIQEMNDVDIVGEWGSEPIDFPIEDVVTVETAESVREAVKETTSPESKSSVTSLSKSSANSWTAEGFTLLTLLWTIPISSLFTNLAYIS